MPGGAIAEMPRTATLRSANPSGPKKADGMANVSGLNGYRDSLRWVAVLHDASAENCSIVVVPMS